MDIAAFDFEGTNFQQPTIISQGKIIPTWMNVILDANLGLSETTRQADTLPIVSDWQMNSEQEVNNFPTYLQ